MEIMDADGKITITEGNTLYIELTDIKINDVTINWTGYHVNFIVKTAVGGKTIIDLSDTSGIDITVNGVMKISKSAAQMASIKARDYVYDLKLTDPSGVVHTWLNNLPFVILPKV